MTPGPAGGFASTGTEVLNIDPRSIDLSKVQRDFEQALDALLDQWVGITAAQRNQIVDQVRSAVTSNDVAALARLSVSTTAAEQTLVEAMTDMSLRAAERVVEEARAQGVRIDPVATDTAPFALTAAALAVLLAQGLTNSAGREALRRWSPTATGDEVSAAVGEHLASLSDSFLAANLGNALSAAENAGRVETMMASPDVALYASEILDANTCKFCRAVDGRWIGNVQDPDIGAKVAALYPNGGYVDCEGGPRCRGQIVAIWRPERTATVEARARNHPGHSDQKSHGRKGLRTDDAAIRETFAFSDNKTGIRAEVSDIRRSETFTSVTIEMRDQAGRVVGLAGRTFDDEDPTSVEHTLMMMDPRLQGQGFATRYNAKVEDAYRAAGIEEITLEAGKTVGGYAWARAGYDFADSRSRAGVARRAKESAKRYGPDVQDEIARVAGNRKASPVEFAMIGHTPGATTWPGKEIMLGSDWQGVKRL